MDLMAYVPQFMEVSNIQVNESKALIKLLSLNQHRNRLYIFRRAACASYCAQLRATKRKGRNNDSNTRGFCLGESTKVVFTAAYIVSEASSDPLVREKHNRGAVRDFKTFTGISLHDTSFQFVQVNFNSRVLKAPLKNDRSF